MSGIVSADSPLVPPELAVLSVAEMYAADHAAAAAGIPSLVLMEAAGAAVARAIMVRWSRQAVTILCGPGNNGGDGYVVARLLHEAGWPVRLACGTGAGQSDAIANAQRWREAGGESIAIGPHVLDGGGLVVDALFGAGLSRPLTPEIRTLVSRINQQRIACIAIDVPSGVSGDTGEVLGGGDDGAPRCAMTVTFFRPKSAHLLYPGRALCGELIVADIGIPASVLGGIRPATCRNTPALWHLPEPGWADHKYTRGHGIVIGGSAMTGAARLAARAARRVGAGLLTLAVPPDSVPIYAGSEVGAFVEPRPGDDLKNVLSDPRRNCVLIGPGCGVGVETRRMVTACLATEKAVVLDADALTSFAQAPRELFEAVASRRAATVMTPHGGEFSRLFGADVTGGKLAHARAAAARAGAVIVYKGADTVVAAPDGRAAIAANGPPWLATGGSGDVLAGLVLGLLAQGCDGWTAATAGVWLHGAAAIAVGRGLIAEDLPEALPKVLQGL
ncbi:MAG: NAD(P)H-hydrate dehydratase [Rhodospirillaceae bacterium]|nr:MAG: NAD(P)H-hydrate dehydratase [Rhodospirillaceae bacterium]